MSLSNKITYISLFSGCGGFDAGFNTSEFECLGAYDIDPVVTDVHSKNLDVPTYIHDLNNLELPGNLPSNIDFVISGSPCQGFSTIGKRVVNDPRNSLLLVGGKIAIQYNAKVFVCENVPGSISGEHRKYWIELQALLKKNGYSTRMIKYEVSDFGVPQLRKRIILYAWKGEDGEIELLSPPKQKVLLRDILNDLSTKNNHNLNFIENKDDLIIANKIKPGQKLCNVRGGERSVHTWNIPEVFGRTNKSEIQFLVTLMKLRRQIRRRSSGDADPVEKKILKRHFNGKTDSLINSLTKKGYIKIVQKKYVELTNTFNGKFKRLDLSTLSPTVDTRFGNYKNFLHPLENRSLSVREAARIQGFGDDFIFHGPIQKQYEMIGNAVPPPLSRFIAKNVKKIIANEQFK
ncbi:DNA cytosine methyltransferase [Pseudoflavitalea rhizosphaerae]|uniref:DNA cytosine methyltransferase n=1 Tax=Pseudoflavitalea rhizosphaerae TaxID=1884793 RepID=UPI000F8D6B9D|nr:DNA cytosine methyltransferase [Pseudoflavitalea rhizosphaerae]